MVLELRGLTDHLPRKEAKEETAILANVETAGSILVDNIILLVEAVGKNHGIDWEIVAIVAGSIIQV